MDGWMDGRTDGRTDWMDWIGWMDGWMDGCIDIDLCLRMCMVSIVHVAGCNVVFSISKKQLEDIVSFACFASTHPTTLYGHHWAPRSAV